MACNLKMLSIKSARFWTTTDVLRAWICCWNSGRRKARRYWRRLHTWIPRSWSESIHASACPSDERCRSDSWEEHKPGRTNQTSDSASSVGHSGTADTEWSAEINGNPSATTLQHPPNTRRRLTKHHNQLIDIFSSTNCSILMILHQNQHWRQDSWYNWSEVRSQKSKSVSGWRQDMSSKYFPG